MEYFQLKANGVSAVLDVHLIKNVPLLQTGKRCAHLYLTQNSRQLPVVALDGCEAGRASR